MIRHTIVNDHDQILGMIDYQDMPSHDILEFPRIPIYIFQIGILFKKKKKIYVSEFFKFQNF